jgi:hypothetical protein
MICVNVMRGSLCVQDNPCVFMSLTMGQVLGHSSTERFLCIAALVWYVNPITGASMLPHSFIHWLRECIVAKYVVLPNG